MNPMASATSRDTTTPTHMFSDSWKVIRAAASAEVTTATPEDRSNSPPIISSATPTATIPIVDEAYRTVANEGSVRNAGAIAKKKTKIAIAATTAPISGRVNTREASDRLTGAGASGVFDGCVGVVAGELMDCSREGWRIRGRCCPATTGGGGGTGPGRVAQRRLLAVKGRIWSMLELSTIDGPVSTGWPPPRSLPLVMFIHSISTDW